MVCEHNVCQCYGDLIWDEENATCVCPTGYSGPFEDGSCKRLHCEPPFCYLNNDLCGYNCGDKAESCFFGTCWPQECPIGTSLQHALFGKYITGGYYWGCQIDNTHCFTRRLGVDIYCLDDSDITQTACCRADNAGNCIKGICNDEECPENGQKVIIEQIENLVGCQYENNINCIPTKYENGHPSIWTCFRSGLECSTNCKNPPECDGECLQVQCPKGTTLQNGMCCKANLCCDYQTNECFIDGKRCGFSCPATRDFADGTTGNCLNKGSTTSTWAYDSTFDLYTCQKGNFSCYNWLNQPQETPICYFNGNKCGSKCSYDATNCQNIFMEDCAADVTYNGKTKKACIYHKPVTETCFCDTDLDTPVGTLCCPAGHVIENGACSIPI